MSLTCMHAKLRSRSDAAVLSATTIILDFDTVVSAVGLYDDDKSNLICIPENQASWREIP